jgi:eukaryotic-like serine/threonine-protein kinase
MTARSIAEAALDKTGGAQRAAYLDSACATDAELRRRVEELLQEHQSAGGVLGPATDSAGDTTDDPGAARAVPTLDQPPPGSPAERPGSWIGPYKLLQEIGEGGMGAVFMAEQDKPVRRRVALKVIKPGMDCAQVVARFEAERQALAMMDHPNIARVLDVGTTDAGRPYFVMELVKGVPITEYCDANRLTPRARLELLVPVCQAIQHAHQKGIIHRDIKPSNVLVTLHDGTPEPKVIDFGVAKAIEQRLTERTLFTQLGQVVGTPEYMSPEQAEMSGLDVDTRSDIYSLGVLMYELLTGSTPLERRRLREAGFVEVLRRVREEEPPRPSTRLSTTEEIASIAARRKTEPAKLARLVRGDLDWIVMKALEKDRTRRYATANGLARDLQRYLADEPVEAGPPSARYRLGKFARRHRAALATAGAFAIVLIAATATSAWLAVRAAKAKDEAVRAYAAEAEQRRQAQGLREIAEQKSHEAQAQATLLERQLYINLIALAQRENLANNVGYAEQLLDRCPRPLRGWEWQFVNRSNHRELFSVGARPRPWIRRAVLNPGEDRVVCCGGNEVWIYDLASGRQLHDLKGHEQAVLALAWSPDGATIASGGMDKTIRLWDPATGNETAVLRGHQGWIFGLAFSPDSRWLLAGTGAPPNVPGTPPEVKLWDYRARREVRPYAGVKGNRVNSVAFAPDGRTIAAADTLWAARLWDVETGQKLRDFEGVHQMPVMNVDFAPDGRTLATCGEDGLVTLWDVATGKSLRVLHGHTGGVDGLALSPNGRRLATGSYDSTIRLWDPETGRETGLLRGHHNAVNALQFDRAGVRLLSSGTDGVAKVWDVSLASDPPVLEDRNGWAYSAAFRPGGWAAATSGWHVIHFWDPATGRRLGSIHTPHPAGVVAIAYSPDGRSLASTGESARSVPDGGAKIWDAETLALRHDLKGHAGAVYGVAYSPDGTTLATAGMDGTVRFWDSATGTVRRVFRAHAKGVVSLAFSPDGARLATVGSEALGSTDTVHPTADTAKLWDVASGDEVLRLDIAIKGSFPFGNAVAFAPDGRCLAVPRADWRVALFNAQTGRLIRDLAGHTAEVNVVAFAPDGRRLATAGDDRTIRLWDPDNGEEMFNLRGHLGGVTWITWSADGRRILTTSTDRTGRIWDSGPPMDEVIRDR